MLARPCVHNKRSDCAECAADRERNRTFTQSDRDKAVQDEREACARLVHHQLFVHRAPVGSYAHLCHVLANLEASIRARSK